MFAKKQGRVMKRRLGGNWKAPQIPKLQLSNTFVNRWETFLTGTLSTKTGINKHDSVSLKKTIKILK